MRVSTVERRQAAHPRLADGDRPACAAFPQPMPPQLVGDTPPTGISNGASGARISDRTGRSAAAVRAQRDKSAASIDRLLNPFGIRTPEWPTMALMRSARVGAGVADRARCGA
jgi:hypothetical protein